LLALEAVEFVRLFEPSSDKVGVLAPAPGLGVLMVLEVRVVVSALEAVEFVRLFEPSSDKVGVLAPAPGLGVLMVLEVRVVVSAIAGVAIMAAMAIAP
jgi:hypothetical protein